MSALFPIIEIPSNAPDALEEMGTKRKFWFFDAERGPCLYKQGRPGTGEDWSEKVAAELCGLLGLPHAQYELATFEGQNGTISPSFLPANSRLVPGNEILAKVIVDYPRNVQDPSQHTISNVLQVIDDAAVSLPPGWIAPSDITKAVDVFIGYLLLDAWIGNTDRHHENWAFIQLEQHNYLAPTYDHASSLGRNESDTRRQKRLSTKDEGFSVKAYAAKARSCLYAEVSEPKPLTTVAAFHKAAKCYPQAASLWLAQLNAVTSADIQALFAKIPDHRISPIAVEFAQQVLAANTTRLRQLSLL